MADSNVLSAAIFEMCLFEKILKKVGESIGDTTDTDTLYEITSEAALEWWDEMTDKERDCQYAGLLMAFHRNGSYINTGEQRLFTLYTDSVRNVWILLLHDYDIKDENVVRMLSCIEGGARQYLTDEMVEATMEDLGIKID